MDNPFPDGAEVTFSEQGLEDYGFDPGIGIVDHYDPSDDTWLVNFDDDERWVQRRHLVLAGSAHASEIARLFGV